MAERKRSVPDCGGQRFESPQLHRKSCANRRDFLLRGNSHDISRDLRRHERTVDHSQTCLPMPHDVIFVALSING